MKQHNTGASARTIPRSMVSGSTATPASTLTPTPETAHVAAALQALLRNPTPRSGTAAGQLKDPMRHTIDLMRAMNATAIDPNNLFRSKLQAGTPSTSPDAVYSPEQAVERANLVYRLIHGAYSSIVRFDISAYVSAAATPAALIDLVDDKLVAGHLSPAARGAIGSALQRTTDHCQRALTALYLAAISAEFAVTM